MGRFQQLLAAASLVMAACFWTLSNAKAQGLDGEELVNARCGACHERLPDGGLSRVSQGRRTPEGWDMTVVRMMLLHGVQMTREERNAIVRHLSDTHGLAPQETAGWRYVLERRPNVLDKNPDELVTVVCARCHTYARVALQRRDRDEWVKLAHFHGGQYPSTEYQALARDRDWWVDATTVVPDKLAQMFPLQTDAWSAWSKAERPSLKGTWRVVGHRPGKGSFYGTANISPLGAGDYLASYELAYADGTALPAEITATVYTGFEWRGAGSMDTVDVREVYAVSEDGNEISGRFFDAQYDEIGGDLRAVRVRQGVPQILAVEPPYLRAGQSTQVTIHGIGFGDGEVSLGEGVAVLELSRDADRVQVTAQTRADAAAGSRQVQVGAARAAGLFTVYDHIDSVRVEPDYGIARVGGGTLDAVTAQFEAVGYLNGADGQAGSDDDVRVGVMPASWAVAPFNEIATAMQDVKFSGRIDQRGLFLPAGAGPNPQRKWSTNNVGDLSVNATVTDGEREVSGSGHLIVTVQRWNDPPIR